LSMIDAKRSINMIRKLQVKVLGIVENFTGEIFGSGAGQEIARDMDLEFLGDLQLRQEYRDTSKPTVLISDEVKDEYKKIAENAIKALESAATPA
ncbi:MAG: P-loop NTPase, partial [Chloroflexi bacterium]|nr:P-loop NTPase [Chloroflexota bacterium]